MSENEIWAAYNGAEGDATFDGLRAVADAARREAMAEAAKIAEDHKCEDYDDACQFVIAEAIRTRGTT